MLQAVKEAKTYSGSDIDPERYIYSCAYTIECHHSIKPHSHDSGQLLLLSKGSARVCIGNRYFHVTPHYAVWIMPNELHTVSSTRGVEYQCVYISRNVCTQLKLPSGILRVSTFMKELINQTIQQGGAYQQNTLGSRLFDVLLGYLEQVEYEQSPVIVPMHSKLAMLCEKVLEDPGCSITLKDWGGMHGGSERNLARVFKRETGMTFKQWSIRVKIQYAIERLRAGDSITSIAYSLGYSSISAFSSAFKTITQSCPSDYTGI